MSETKLTAVKNAEELIVIEPRSEIFPKYEARAENDAAKVFLKKPFSIPMSNFGEKERKFIQGIGFTSATKHAIFSVPIVGLSGKILGDV